MQTFLPYPDFQNSLRILDNKRLGKQRVEAYQILRALQTNNGWRNHPAVKMWRGYERALCLYGETACILWIRRGFDDNLLMKFLIELKKYPMTQGFPDWFGNEQFHLSHRSNLLRKDKKHYSQFFPADTPNNIGYYWPS